MSQIVKDYISMSRRNFRKAHPDESDFLNDIEMLQFNLSHVSDEAKNSTNKENYKVILKDKGFSNTYINGYMKSITASDGHEEMSLESLTHYFNYQGNPLTVNDIKGNLKQSGLTRKQGFSDEEVLNVIELVQRLNPSISGINVLESKVKSKVRDTVKLDINIEDILGDIDPRLTESREKIYKYYEGIHPLYAKMKLIIKDILLSWDRVEEELDAEQKKTGNLIIGDGIINDLDDDLTELKEIYDMMDDELNYVVTMNPIQVPIYPDSDEGSSLVASNIIYNYLKEIQSQSSGQGLDLPTTNEDEKELDALQISEQDEEMESYMSFDNKEGGDSRPKGEFYINQKTEEDKKDETWAKKISNLQSIDVADPLYVIATDSDIVKHRHNQTTKRRLQNDLRNIIEEMEEDEELLGSFEELLEEIEEIQNQATEVTRSEYYLPYSQSVLKLQTQYQKQSLKGIPDIEKIEIFHTRVLKAISDLIELPSEKTLLPYHWRKDDFSNTIEGAPRTKDEQEKEKKYSNLIESTQVGKTGQLKDLGDFVDDVMRLIAVAEDYYANPVNDQMIPFGTPLSFMNKRSISAITSHGNNEISKLVQTIYIEYYTAFISKTELQDINDYRRILTDAPSDIKMKTTIQKVENVIDILNDMFPNTKDNETVYFANKINNMARKNSEIDLSKFKLNGKKINELVTEEDVKSNYIRLIGLIYATASEMKKDSNKKEEVETFMRLHKSFEDKIKLSQTQEKLLFAYDGIRKMMQKPTYYGICSVDSFDNVSDTIDLIKSKYRLDVTANDITRIVEEVDSLDSLAKKHGTNEDVIYHIKAMYR